MVPDAARAEHDRGEAEVKAKHDNSDSKRDNIDSNCGDNEDRDDGEHDDGESDSKNTYCTKTKMTHQGA